MRRAVQLLADSREGPIEALGPHLQDFARFVLGLGRDVVLAQPYETELPLALPGTDLALTGAGRVRIRALVDGTIEVVHDGRDLRLAPRETQPPGAPRVEVCPVVTVGEARVALNPYLFGLPGFGLSGELAGLGLDFQERHAALVADALGAFRRFLPSAFAHFADVVRTIAVKPTRQGSFGTLSSSELPGAFVCSVPADPFALAADFIHEFHHNRLFFIEETGPFFEAGGEDAIEAELHYSPWRDAPRPLHGILHAVYVYLPVFRFWCAVCREGALEAVQLDYARDQLARIPFQVRTGMNQLRRQARFTPFGSALFEAMEREVAPFEDEAVALGAHLGVPAVTCRASGALRPVVEASGGRPLTVGETLLDHLVRRDTRRECAEERATLEQALGRRFMPGAG